MGYEDDFYKKENILGYTGKIKEDPTVYFASASGDTEDVNDRQQLLTKFGHITQYHDQENNIGRELVRECYSYSICNDDSQYAIESVYGEDEWKKLGTNKKYGLQENVHKPFHTSRKRFIPVNSENIETLEHAITTYENKKTRYK